MYVKYGNKQQLSNIFDTKFRSHKEHSIGFFANTNPRVILRDTLRNDIQDELMWID